MSEPASALGDAHFDGIVTVTETSPRGMITVRGDLGSKSLQDAVSTGSGLSIPGKGSATTNGARAVLWMSPDEMLVLLPHADTAGAVSAMSAKLTGKHALVVDVSDARTVFSLEGEGALLRDTLAKLTPADLRPGALPVGQIRRTRFAQVPAAFWFVEDSRVDLICFRSVADYVFGILKHAATPGSEVSYFT